MRASAIRYLLLSVPYRHQMNFTFEGLAAATNAIDRLRTFHERMLRSVFPAGAADAAVTAATAKAAQDFTAALANDLNTAEAAAAISEMVRDGELRRRRGDARRRRMRRRFCACSICSTMCSRCWWIAMRN